MPVPLTRARRYQLRREAVTTIAGGHPWVFRKHLSSAAQVFADGQWLTLYDGDNRVVGTGMYEAEGAIGIRVIRRGDAAPDRAWLDATLDEALARRKSLRKSTDGYRVLHGENDGVPAVTFDVFGSLGVVQTYARGAEVLGRLAATVVRRRLGLERVLWKPAHRSRHQLTPPPRWLFGQAPSEASFREGELRFAVDVVGQKSGAFLDLRGLRRYLGRMPLERARVLDLFAYAGGLGAAAAAGAREIWHVDASAASLALGAAHHAVGPAEHRWIEADIFSWLPALSPDERFDLVILDPPQMTSKVEQVPRALAGYRKLYKAAAPHVAPGGTLVACCCTSRIALPALRRAVQGALGDEFRFIERIPAEPDHPIAFAQGEYLKILVYRRADAASA